MVFRCGGLLGLDSGRNGYPEKKPAGALVHGSTKAAAMPCVIRLGGWLLLALRGLRRAAAGGFALGPRKANALPRWRPAARAAVAGRCGDPPGAGLDHGLAF